MPIALKAAFKLIYISNDRSVVIKTGESSEMIKLSQIMFYETEKRKVIIHTKSYGQFAIWKTMKEMQELISEAYFIPLHRGCVVNANYIKSIGDSQVTLYNSQKLIISRTRLKSVKENLLQYWGNLI